MNCDTCLRLLDDHLDGLLDPVDDRALGEHLRRCSACAEEAAALEALLADARRLPDSIEPRRDLWSAIEPRLGRPARRPGLHPGLLATLLAVAATLVLAIAGGAYRLMSAPAAAAGGVPDRPAAAALAAANAAVPEGSIDEAQRAFDEARRSLLLALESKRGSLSPETQAMVDENLRIVEDAVAQIRAALTKDPANLQLSRMLVSYHHRELELLQSVTRQATRL